MKKPPGGRLDEHVGWPRVLGNDDDGGQELVTVGHRCPFNPLGAPIINHDAQPLVEFLCMNVADLVDDDSIPGGKRKVPGITL